MTSTTPIRIFLTAPDDVVEERVLALRLIDQVTHDPALDGQVDVEIVTWDIPGGFLTPAEAEAHGLPRPSECDVVVLILWQTMGPPLPDDHRKPDGRPYVSGQEWAYEDAFRTFRRTGKPFILVYRRMAQTPLKLSDPNFTRKERQRREIETFFAGFYDENGILAQNYSRYDTRRAFWEHFEQHLTLQVRILVEATDEIEDTITVRPPTWEGSPYPGLRAFAPDEAPIFFGREAETGGLVMRLRAPDCRFLAVTGKSGVGKSSLVSAGLLPQLMDDAVPGSKDWVFMRIVPGEVEGNPFFALANRFAPFFERPGWEQTLDLTEKLAHDLYENPDMINRVSQSVLAGRRESAELLLFVDQFEELFNVVEERYRTPFFHLLAYATTVERVRVIITLNTDFYGRCMDWPQLALLLQNGVYALSSPGEAARRAMIVEPAARARLDLDADLIDWIARDTGDSLPQMAYVLHQLYLAGTFSVDAYEGIGGAAGAIESRLQDVFEDLDEAAYDALPDVFQVLIRVDEYGAASRYIPYRRVTGTPAKARLVEALIDKGILSHRRGGSDQPIISLAHDILFQTWPQLIRWIETVQDDLRVLRRMKLAAQEWYDNDRQPEYLWSDQRLQPIYDIVERLQPELTDIQREFIQLESDQLLMELTNPRTTHARRAEIGQRLAEIGDPRPGVGLQPDGLPDIVWCHVPAGEVWLSDDVYPVNAFYIAKYPITFAQFEAFIETEDGYWDAQWWDGLLEYPPEPGEQTWPIANHPRENVSWYDAVAFCRWLSVQRGYTIRLPYEWEWQQAATGGIDRHVYPWGMTWNAACANTSESGLSCTTAVGMYPLGASPVGALDMCGNVWEWCLNEYHDTENTGLSGNIRRVARGGAWGFYQSFAQTTASDWPDPTYRFNVLGFRVATTVIE